MSGLLEIVIKTTDACNATCAYCAAASGPAGRRKLPIETARLVLDQAGRLIAEGRFQRVRVIWHGGEPLLLGKAFFRELAKFGLRPGLAHRIQTNLTLLDAEWLDLLAPLVGPDGVGTSVDPFSDLRRLGGDDYTRHWLGGLSLLDEAGWRVGCVYVVHRGSLQRAGDVYWFFRNLRDNARLSLRVNPLLAVGRATGGLGTDISLRPGDYASFLMALAGEWLSDHRRLVLSPLDEFVAAIEGIGGVRACDLAGRAACVDAHLGIDPDGDVYNCGRAVDAGGASFGNLSTISLGECLDHPARQALREREGTLLAEQCGTCRYWRLCHGGCLYESHAESELAHRPTALCEDYRRLFEWLGKRLRAAQPVATRVANGQADAQSSSVPVAGATGPEHVPATTIVVGPEEGSGVVRYLAARGTPVKLGRLRDWPAAELISLADFFLHSSGLEVPIEPFYSLLVSLQPGGAACSLPAMYQEPRGRSDPLSSCGTCSAFKSCRGYWAHPTPQLDHCNAWRRIRSALRETELTA